MASRALAVDDFRHAAGSEIMKLLDSVGFTVWAAGWLHVQDPDTKEGGWRFYIATPLMDEKGPMWIYERLLKAFNKVGLPKGITPLDIFVASTSEKLFVALTSAFKGGYNLSFTDSKIGDVHIDKAFFYKATNKDAAKPALFDMRVKKLLRAA